MNLTIFHTNDLHGRIDELACLTSQARRLRAQVEAAGGHSLLVDCGDAEERTVLEIAVTRGSAAMAYLRAAGYELSAVGNGAALSYGPQVLPTMAETAGFPLLAANLLDQEGRLVAGCTPSVLREIGDVRLGFVGLAPRWHLWSLFGLQNPEPAPLVAPEIERLRGQGATVIILLSHLGLAGDLELLGKVKGIDLILGGHSHTTIFGGLLQGGVLIAQAGDHGRFLGRVDLEIDDSSGQILRKTARLLPLDMTEEPDGAVLDAIDEQQALVAEILAEEIGEVSATLTFDAIAESPLANLLADALRQRTGADVALCQSTHLLASISPGVVTLRRIYRACKSPGNPAVRSLTGAQLLELLEAGLDEERARQTAHWGRGRPNGRMAVSGLTACYDPAASPGQRLSDVLVDGQPLDPARSYQVAGTDAEMTNLTWRRPGHPPDLSFDLDEDSPRYEVPTVMRDVLEDHIRRNSPITPPAVGRIRSA